MNKFNDNLNLIETQIPSIFPKTSIKVPIKITATVCTDIEITPFSSLITPRRQTTLEFTQKKFVENHTKRVTICHSKCLRWHSREGEREKGRDNSSIHQTFYRISTPLELNPKSTWEKKQWIWNGQQAGKTTIYG